MAALGLRNRRSQAQSDYTSLSRVCLLSEQLDTLTFIFYSVTSESPTACVAVPVPLMPARPKRRRKRQAQGWEAGARKRLTPEPPRASFGILYRMTVCVTGRQARAARSPRAQEAYVYDRPVVALRNLNYIVDCDRGVCARGTPRVKGCVQTTVHRLYTISRSATASPAHT